MLTLVAFADGLEEEACLVRLECEVAHFVDDQDRGGRTTTNAPPVLVMDSPRGVVMVHLLLFGVEMIEYRGRGPASPERRTRMA